METSQKNNYKNEHIVSKNALSVTGIVILIIAAASFYAGSLFGENSVLNMSLFILGIALGIFGFIKIFMGKKVFYHKETGKKVLSKRLTFSKNEKNRLEKILQEKNFEQIGSITLGENKSSDIRLDIYISTDKQYASAQIMEFIPFEYQAIGRATEYTGHDAELLAEIIA